MSNNADTKKKPSYLDAYPIPADAIKTENDIDLNKLYERATDELGLQQSKRDQIITVYLAMFSFLIPFALSLDILSWREKGYIFLAAAIVGILFSGIIVRYRIYKEAYWLCCRTITMLFGIKREHLNKTVIQNCYRKAMYKKGSKYLLTRTKKNKSGEEVTVTKFRILKFIWDNLFSSETIHFFIHEFITSLIFGLSIALILPYEVRTNVLIAVSSAVVLFLALSVKYFNECMKVYAALLDHEDDDDKRFNFAFGKAWFLHFYLDDEEEEKKS